MSSCCCRAVRSCFSICPSLYIPCLVAIDLNQHVTLLRARAVHLFVLQSQHASNNQLMFLDVERRMKTGCMLERQMSLEFIGKKAEVKHSAVISQITKQ